MRTAQDLIARAGTGPLEIAEMVAADAHEVGSAHGLDVFGLAQAFKAASEIAEGLQSSGELLTAQREKGKAI